jgi:hypothetical protein
VQTLTIVTLSGVVTNRNTGAPIAGATVEVSSLTGPNAGKSTTTDAAGRGVQHHGHRADLLGDVPEFHGRHESVQGHHPVDLQQERPDGDFLYVSCQIDSGGDSGSIFVRILKHGVIVASASANGFPNIATADAVY